MKSRNALGLLLKSLSKAKRQKIYEVAQAIREDYAYKNFRQYFYLNKSNPAKIDTKVQEELIKIEPQFKFCFVPNYQSEIALEKLSIKPED